MTNAVRTTRWPGRPMVLPSPPRTSQASSARASLLTIRRFEPILGLRLGRVWPGSNLKKGYMGKLHVHGESRQCRVGAVWVDELNGSARLIPASSPGPRHRMAHSYLGQVRDLIPWPLGGISHVSRSGADNLAVGGYLFDSNYESYYYHRPCSATILREQFCKRQCDNQNLLLHSALETRMIRLANKGVRHSPITALCTLRHEDPVHRGSLHTSPSYASFLGSAHARYPADLRSFWV
jgi:hypothetical protein